MNITLGPLPEMEAEDYEIFPTFACGELTGLCRQPNFSFRGAGPRQERSPLRETSLCESSRSHRLEAASSNLPFRPFSGLREGTVPGNSGTSSRNQRPLLNVI